MNSFRDIRPFTVRAYCQDTIVFSTLKAESLYSDEYSFTAKLTLFTHSFVRITSSLVSAPPTDLCSFTAVA